MDVVLYMYIIRVVSVTAVVTTILQFLSGILVCKQYYCNGTTGESSPLPFMFGVLSASVWLLYGLIKPDENIVTVNVIGVTLMIIYLLIFFIFTVKKYAVLKLVILMGLILFLVIGYTTVAQDYDLLLNQLGLLASSLTILMVASPLSKLLHVIKVKNTECLPFPMILMAFFVSSLWFCYGILEEDSYLTLPNFIGAVLAASQLALFVIYPNKTTKNYKPLLA